MLHFHEFLAVLGGSESRAWHPLAPSRVSLPPPGQVKHIGGKGAVFCALSRWLLVFVLFLGLLLVLFALGLVEHYSFVVLVSGVCSWVSRVACGALGLDSLGYDAFHGDLRENLLHMFYVLVQHAPWLDSGYLFMVGGLLGSTVNTCSSAQRNAWVDNGYISCHIQRLLGELHTFSTSRCSHWKSGNYFHEPLVLYVDGR